MSTYIAHQYEKNVAPIWTDAAKAKVANDVANAFYAKSPKDLVETSVYNKVGEAPTVDSKLGRIINTSA